MSLQSTKMQNFTIVLRDVYSQQPIAVWDTAKQFVKVFSSAVVMTN